MTASNHKWVVVAEQIAATEIPPRRVEWCSECGALRFEGTIRFAAAFQSNESNESIVDPRPWGEVCPR